VNANSADFKTFGIPAESRAAITHAIMFYLDCKFENKNVFMELTKDKYQSMKEKMFVLSHIR